MELCKCLTVNERAIANAEYVIEGEVIPGVRVKEDQNSNTGYAMPEFPGYTGPASDQCWLIKVTAVTHRENPIMQTCIGPSEEHVSMAGIPTEASIYGMVEKAMPGRLQNVYCSSAGGGKYMAVLQFKKLSQSDEGRQRQAALLAFSAFSELKNVFLVDEDVDCFDMNDVLWAMNTRFQGDVDVITIPGVRCHPLDLSNDPAFSPSIRDHGIACKTIFDCTVPYDLKEDFHRARFMELDPEKWLKNEKENYSWCDRCKRPAAPCKMSGDHPGEIGAKPASGSFKTEGMLIVPCSMKTIAGIHSGYADNLILRAADVTVKEQRTLVLAARETPLSGIHLRNLYELSMLPGVRIIPPMLTFYHKPESIDDMVYHIAAKLLEPFGIEAKEYRRWNGL